MAPVPRVLGWGSLTPSREARRDCVDGGSGPPHPGAVPSAPGEQPHRARKAVLGLLSSGNLPARMPTPPVYSLGQGWSDTSHGWYRRSLSKCTISWPSGERAPDTLDQCELELASTNPWGRAQAQGGRGSGQEKAPLFPVGNQGRLDCSGPGAGGSPVVDELGSCWGQG